VLAEKASDVSAALRGGWECVASGTAATAGSAPCNCEVEAGPSGTRAQGGAERSGTGESIYKLSGNKFASVSDFKGNHSIDLREYYMKDDNWMPGKKGIRVTVEQFEVLQEHSEVCHIALLATLCYWPHCASGYIALLVVDHEMWTRGGCRTGICALLGSW
jgi:hypothetical protein